MEAEQPTSSSSEAKADDETPLTINVESVQETDELFSVMVLSGVLCTSALIVTNKLILDNLPSNAASGSLGCLHAMVALVVTRIKFHVSGTTSSVPPVPWNWMLGVSLIATVALLVSNLALQYASVTFHQLARLTAMPAGAAVDYFRRGVKRSGSDWIGFLLLSGGVFLTAKGDLAVTPLGAFFSALTVLTWLGAAEAVRQTCSNYSLSSAEYMFVSGPWNMGCGIFWLFATGGGSTLAAQARGLLLMDFSYTVKFGLMVNLTLAVIVQYLSSWAQKNCSTVLYAVLAQAKTGCTILMGVFVMGSSMSGAVLVGILTCLTVSGCIAAREAISKAENNNTPDSMTLRVLRVIDSSRELAWMGLGGLVLIALTFETMHAKPRFD